MMRPFIFLDFSGDHFFHAYESRKKSVDSFFREHLESLSLVIEE